MKTSGQIGYSGRLLRSLPVAMAQRTRGCGRLCWASGIRRPACVVEL